MFKTRLFTTLTAIIAIFALTNTASADTPRDGIVTVNTSFYTFERMENELRRLKERYPDCVDYMPFGKSHYGLPLYAARFGSANADHRILITGNTHAREYMTTQLVMMQLEELCAQYAEQRYCGVSYQRIFDSAAIWFVPSLNPDGTRLSQFGGAKIPQKYKDSVLKIPFGGEAYAFTHWKANGVGVDLNRNYPFGWERKNSVMAKNFEGYRPASEPEIQALMELCEENAFDLALSYHSSGEVIFWRQAGLDDAVAYPLAKRVSALTSYALDEDDTSDGGFKGWFVSTFARPCFTIEIGIGASPLPLCQLEKIYEQNRYVPIVCAWEIYNAKQ